MKIQYYTAVSLDGYIADENHSLDWLFQFGEVEDTSYPDFIRDVGVLVMGSSTYEWLLRNEIYADPTAPKPWPYDLPTWIFTSRTLEKVPGADIRFANGAVEPVYREIAAAAGGKNIWIVGGGALAAQFYEARLLDEIILTIAPVILTRGAPVFTSRIDSPPLHVAGVRTYANGLTELRLEVVRRGDEGGGMSSYTPIECSLHDQLESLATLGRACRVVYRDDSGEERETEGRLVDVFARGGAEYVRLDSGVEIRLDRLEWVDGVRFGGGEVC